VALTIRALKPRNGFAGEVIGIDLRQSVSDADFETIRSNVRPRSPGLK